MLRLSNIKCSVAPEGVTIKKLQSKIARALNVTPKQILNVSIAKQSIDARDKKRIFYVVSADFDIKDENLYTAVKNISIPKPFEYAIPTIKSSQRPVVVGFGPAGMMCGLILARAGLKPIIIERGRAVDERKKDVDTFWTSGTLSTTSNVQFGEGGAGAFSDGKLTTGIKNPRCRLVLEEFVKHGAPESILYITKPHIGTDKLLPMVKSIRSEIQALGGEIYFESQLTDILSKAGALKAIEVSSKDKKQIIDTTSLVLAIGHSARDTFELLNSKNIAMQKKTFAMGVRIEHSQEMINISQYGDFHNNLPPADYKLVSHLPNGRSLYTFCMCPGGVVVAASSEQNSVVTNGMSYYARDGKNANSALLININPEDLDSDVLSGVKFQRELEHKAFLLGGSNYSAPIQLVGDILADRKTTTVSNITPTYMPGTTGSDFSKLFPEFIYSSLKQGIQAMDKHLKGFASDGAVLTAVESRSSSPVQIIRDKKMQSLTLRGLYPCGEGGGYAGGIMSAAVDGIKCAEAIIEELKNV